MPGYRREPMVTRMPTPAPNPSLPLLRGDDPADDELRKNRPLLVIACLFTVVGGYLDAYAYLAHGHVFANAQTGNVILSAVAAAAGQWTQAVRHLPPIMAFALGVAVAQWLGVRTKKRDFHATLFCQALEIVILAALAVFAERLPDAGVVPTLSFVAALQNTSFSHVGPWSFTSPMTTGNLREAVSGLTLWLLGRDAARSRGQAIVLGWVCLSFAAGAVGGSACTRRDAGHALLPCLVLVAAGFVLTWRERHRRQCSPRPVPPSA